MKKTYGVGVIGAGHAGRKHLMAIHDHPQTRVVGVAVARPSQQRAAALRAKFGAEFVTEDYRRLLARDDVEIICISSPNRFHAQQSLDALAAGKHVLCEKPMVTSIEDARRVVAASQSASTSFLVGQICRFSPIFLAIKQLYDDGDLGQAFFAEADYIKQSLHVHKRWWLDPREPHFIVFNGGVHPLDLLRQPRTAVGLDRAGRTLYLVVVDGRQPGYSVGLRLTQMARLMLELGCYSALNLDGGGSSTLVICSAAGTGCRALNSPSGHRGEGGERIVGNHLGFFAAPVGGPKALKDRTIR